MMNPNGQTLIQKFDLTVDQLEPKYIRKCSDVKLLEKILKVLRSGEEGSYPQLESLCEGQIRSKDPKNRLLRKEEKLRTFKDLSNNEQSEVDEIGNWVSEMKNKDGLVIVNNGSAGDDSNAADLPPIRSVKKMIGEVVKEEPIVKSTKISAPKSHREWDKIVSQLEDKENEEEEEEDIKKEDTGIKSKKNRSLTNTINTGGLSDTQIEVLANKEKDKGNEAFRSNDLLEAITYYNRSLSVLESPATYNNRALAYYKMGKWSDAVKDCDRVLREEHFNLKARLRRAAAYKELRKFRQAQADLNLVLQEEPHNPRAQEIMKQVEEELSVEERRRKEGKGKIMTIEETDGESSDEEEITPNVATNQSNGVDNQPADNVEIAQKPQTRSTRVEIEESESEEETDQSDILQSKLEQSDILQSKPEQSKSLNETQPETTSVQVIQPEVLSEKPQDPGKTSESQEVKTRTSSIYNIIQQNIANNHDKPVEQTPTPARASNTEPNASETISKPDHPAPGNSTKCDQLVVEDRSIAETVEECSVMKAVIHEQPVIVKVPALPVDIDNLKQEGNRLFKNGQYGEAISYYTQAIKQLETDSTLDYHRGQILSNRAACQLKIGACKSAVMDCDEALMLIPYNTKSLLRRATAYETLEKYVEAYTDYKQITVLENSDNAFTGANRCQTFLNQQHGPKWRTKIPKVSSLTNLPQFELGVASTSNSTSNSQNQTNASSPEHKPSAPSENSDFIPTVPSSQQSASSKPVKSVEFQKPQLPADESFYKLKEEGNKLVSKSEFKLAIDKYTTALNYDSDNIAVYSNRAFCYIKTEQPESALKDCNTVLAMDNQHIKALYRRGLSYKMMEKYKESLADLMSVLKLDPNNSAAKKEADSVKESYKRELQSMKNKPVEKTRAETKKTRVLIEEASDDEQKSSSPTPTHPKSKSRSKKSKKKQNQTQQSAVLSSSTPQAPTLSHNPTPYEFTTAWTSLKGNSDLNLYSKLIRQVPPNNMGKVLSNKLEADQLEKIILSLDKCFKADELSKVEEYLKSISTVSRFSMITMLMSAQCKSSLENIFKKLNSSSKHVDKLKIAYGISK